MTRRAILAASGVVLSGCGAVEGPVFRGLFAPGNALTYLTHRYLLPRQSRAREFGRSMISPHFPIVGTSNPKSKEYQHLKAGGFVDWRLPVSGLVARPASLSLADLRAMPSRSHITMQACEEGWTAIAEWTGVTVATLLEHVGLKEEGRFVVFESSDDGWDCIDLEDALHPQTMLAYGMNGPTMPIGHGAPLRLRVERQLGYKNLKFVSGVRVVARIDDLKDGTGSWSHAGGGYQWYAGI
jgi:DMSO/TMAO reductase YedYZ molybdopterin-dependent catalytic subunit